MEARHEIEEVTAPGADLLEYLERDLVRIPFELYNLLNGPDRPRLYVSSCRGKFTGYLFITKLPEAAFAVLSGEPGAIPGLLSFVPMAGTVIIAPASLLETIQRSIPPSPVFSMFLMVVHRGEETLVPDNPAVRVSPGFAGEYARLVDSRSPSRCEEVLGRETIYGVFSDGKLVSVASAVGKLPKAAFIMGVITSPEYRGRGYATFATSAALEEALRSSGLASLGVREDNLPAIRIYRRLGFKPVGREVWIDLGTGLKP